MAVEASGIEQGQRRLNGIQTAGREFRNLSEPSYRVLRVESVPAETRDGTTLMTDVYRPDAEGRFPALLAFSPYPRQIQNLRAPVGVVEAGASDFFVPRGYVHMIANARGTSGSEGTWGLLDAQERDDLYDLVEWVASQPWCDGNVGMLGISYFAMAQIAAAVSRPPSLRAIFPLGTNESVYDVAWHHGLLSSGFLSAWISAVGILAEKSDAFWRSKGLRCRPGRPLESTRPPAPGARQRRSARYDAEDVPAIELSRGPLRPALAAGRGRAPDLRRLLGRARLQGRLGRRRNPGLPRLRLGQRDHAPPRHVYELEGARAQPQRVDEPAAGGWAQLAMGEHAL